MTKIFFFFSIIVVHLFLISNLWKQGKLVSETNELQLTHLMAEKFIEKDLFQKCTTFSNSDVKSKISKIFEENGMKFDLVSQKIIDIKNLSYSKVIFRSFLKTNEAIFHQTEGYLVTHKTSRKCFGII